MGKSAVELLETIDKSLDLHSDGPHTTPVLSGELTRWEEDDNLNVLSLDDGKLVLKVHEKKELDSDPMGNPLLEVWISPKGNPMRARRIQNKRRLLEEFGFQKVELNGRTEPKTAILLETEPTEGREFPRVVIFEDQSIGLVTEPKNLKKFYRGEDIVQVVKHENGTVQIIDGDYI
jgi:hypothetical protein